MIRPRPLLKWTSLVEAKSLKILPSRVHPGLEHRAPVVLHARLGGVVGLAPGGRRVQERQNPDREGRRGEERCDDDDAKAEYDSPARKRGISGSGDDVA